MFLTSILSLTNFSTDGGKALARTGQIAREHGAVASARLAPKALPETVVFRQYTPVAERAAQWEDGMNRKFSNVWVELSIRQACNYRLVNQVITKSFETCWLLGPQSLVDCWLPRTDEPLNPLEFHGKRQVE